MTTYDAPIRTALPPVDDEERRARIIMSWVAEPGDADACRLVRDHSAAALVERLRSRPAEQSKLRDWSERVGSVDYDNLRRIADRLRARYVCPADDDWPPPLDDVEMLGGGAGERRGGAAFGLWVRGPGSLRSLTSQAVSFVGARAATAYGEHVSGDLAMGCCQRGFTVVSGGAYGIDAAAHRGAIAAGQPTVAVLASGPDRLYPAGNTSLLVEIARSGLVVSEAAPGCVPSRSRFLVRNRLIAALSQGTVVVEAALRSGSLNTARWARDLGRGVMGVPGPITSMTSGGVHELLRQPETLLVTDADEIVEHISPAGAGLAPVKAGPVRPRDELEPRSRQLLDAVPKLTRASSESIAAAAGLEHADVVERLCALDRLGLVTVDGGRWRLG